MITTRRFCARSIGNEPLTKPGGWHDNGLCENRYVRSELEHVLHGAVHKCRGCGLYTCLTWTSHFAEPQTMLQDLEITKDGTVRPLGMRGFPPDDSYREHEE